MSAIIKGFEVPRKCADCFLRGGLWCYALEPEEKRISQTGKREDCPLVQLPKKHGRLVDADALAADYSAEIEKLKTLGQDHKQAGNLDALRACNIRAAYLDEAKQRTKAAATIIEAEGGGWDG